jgi:general secretion pathway protein M
MSTSTPSFLEQCNPRERQLIVIAGGLLAAALLWFLAIAPALQTYRASAAAHAKLDTELAQMQRMASEANKLKAMPRANPAAVQTWLDGATKKIGKATATLQGGRVQISFTGASPEALAAFLAEARTRAQLVPSEAHWKKSVGSPSPNPSNASPQWDGSIVFELAK